MSIDSLSGPRTRVSGDVMRWRRERLVDAGFEHDLASELAADGGYDLHVLLSLVDDGCPPDLAARILAPL